MLTKIVSGDGPSVKRLGVPQFMYEKTIELFYREPLVWRTLKIFVRFLGAYDAKYEQVFPSVRKISRQTGLATTTVERMRVVAERLNILETGKHKSAGHRTTNSYTFTSAFREKLHEVALSSDEHNVVFNQTQRRVQSDTYSSSVVFSSNRKKRSFPSHGKRRKPLKLAE